jgi:hypothetical protein
MDDLNAISTARPQGVTTEGERVAQEQKRRDEEDAKLKVG